MEKTTKFYIFFLDSFRSLKNLCQIRSYFRHLISLSLRLGCCNKAIMIIFLSANATQATNNKVLIESKDEQTKQGAIIFWLRGILQDLPDILPEIAFIKHNDNNQKSCNTAYRTGLNFGFVGIYVICQIFWPKLLS